MMKATCLLAFLACTGFQAMAVRAEQADTYRITSDVALADPPRFSINVDMGAFAPWNVDQRVNAWNLFYNLEPMVMQHHGQCDGGGEDFAEHKTAPRFSFWDCGRSGYWDGAEVRFYRLENGTLSLLRVSTVKRSVIGNDPATDEKTEERLYLADKGPAIRAGDFYVLRQTSTEVSPHFRPALLGGSSNYLIDGWCNFQGNVKWRFDTNTFAPEGGSTASLRMELTEATASRPSGPWHWFLINNDDEPHIHLQFIPGKKYKARVWLKQSGMSDPRALVQLGVFTSAIVEVGTEWKQYTFDLPVDHPASPMPKRQNDGSRLLVGGLSNGTLWMDNLLVWQTDVEPFDLLPQFVEALRDFHPGTLRLWGGYISPSLDYWLGDGFAQLNSADYGKANRPVGFSLYRSLKLCADIGADPWLILNPFFTKEEHAQLMEYLAGPADKGYGQLRAKQGRKEPWTRAFKTIHLESANEAWNTIFRLNWSGRPEVYAAIADRQFRELQASPYFDKSRFEFIADGWDSQMYPQGWTHRLAMSSKLADRIDMACYFGGWEAGKFLVEGQSDEVYQDKLLTTPVEFGRKIADSLVLNADLTRSLCASLQNDKELLTRGLASFDSSRVRWTPEQLTPAAGLPAAAAMRDLWARDTNFAASIKSVLTNRRQEMERVLWTVAQKAMGSDPALQPIARAALHLHGNEITPELCLGLADLNAPSRLAPLIKTNPATVSAWLAGDFFKGDARKDLEAFQAGSEKLTYNITNELGKSLRAAILTEIAAGNEKLFEAMKREATPEMIQSGLNLLDYVTRGMFLEPAQRRTEQVMLTMKQHPDFAADVVRLLAKDTSIFREVAADIAGEFARSMAALYSGAESFRPDDERNLMLRILPEAVSRELTSRLRREVQNSLGTFSKETQLFLLPMIDASSGNTGPALALEENAEMITSLESFMSGALPLPFLEAAKQDASFGDRLVAQLTQHPAPGTKGIAIYEGGPGYALPGPGKPPSEEDENVGKSLVMGTANLDAFMQFLAARVAPLCYYNFKSGSHWASHTDPIKMIPYPSWLGLQMVNANCRGDLMKVERTGGQLADIEDKEVIRTTNDGKGSKQKVYGRKQVPLSMCYAYRDGKHYSILLLNRELKNARPVQLELPGHGSKATKAFLLTNADPKANNRSDYNVHITEREGPPLKSGMTLNIPPASAMLLTGDLE